MRIVPSVVGLVFAVLVFAAPAHAQDEAADRKAQELAERDALNVADFENLTVVVLGIEPNTAKITEDAVKSRLDSRMKAAGLTVRSETSDHFLLVSVHVDGAAFNIDIGFYRSASWELPDGRIAHNFLETWNSGHTLGTHDDSAPNILRELDTRLDQFLNAYLKANQKPK